MFTSGNWSFLSLQYLSAYLKSKGIKHQADDEATALIVLIQNGWVENWTWYDMLRNRRLIKVVAEARMSGVKTDTFMQYLQLRIASCDLTVCDFLDSESTSTLPYTGKGKTSTPEGPTLNHLLMSGRPVCHCAEENNAYLPSKLYTLLPSGHRITMNWHISQIADDKFRIKGDPVKVTGKRLRLSYGRYTF